MKLVDFLAHKKSFCVCWEDIQIKRCLFVPLRLLITFRYYNFYTHLVFSPGLPFFTALKV